MVPLLFLSWVLLLRLPLGACDKESAWNGQTPPQAKELAPFRPYYVPPGAESHDSASRAIRYTGQWSVIFSPNYVDHSIHYTTEPGAFLTFTFKGTGVEWFGNMDNRHGYADVYINKKHVRRVDNWAETKRPRTQQRLFWKFNLPCAMHEIKIVNVGKHPGVRRATRMDIDAFVVTRPKSCRSGRLDARTHSDGDISDSLLDSQQLWKRDPTAWSLQLAGSTGVNAMQLAVISETHALIVDKVEHNPLNYEGHPAWAALYDFNTHSVHPLDVQSNSFCAGGSFLANGTLINVGGNPVVTDTTSAADFGDLDGMQAVRLFHPCDHHIVTRCSIYENHNRIRMASPRWYNTVVRIPDGSAMIIGGSKKGGWINNATVNNPTIEFYPPKPIHGSGGLPIPLPFLVDTLYSNLFPIAFVLPDGKVFMAANTDAMIYDWIENKERRLPGIPNGVRCTYPMTGSGILLPLSPENGYKPEILICGGSAIDDKKPSYEISSKDPASAQCVRITLTDEGISKGWEIEAMPQARTMGDAVLLPTGDVLIVNGAGSGISGYGNVRNQVGGSNAANPVLRPVLYKPYAPPAERFSSEGMPTSRIPRMYHSVASLMPNGNIMIAGSNPNLDRSEDEFGTEYRVEHLHPPYSSKERPKFLERITHIPYHNTVSVRVDIKECATKDSIQVALMDLGYVTHAVHANGRLVYLNFECMDGKLVIKGPPNGNVYPPGPGFLFIVLDGIPSQGMKVMMGEGHGPPVDQQAIENVIANTKLEEHSETNIGG
ncbi:hypothetical protein AX16_008876 [Volvariella volvacea WC 439]|nr:hypothetical protein AX16_008876 [Volvariella volvacea WC 439]